MTALAAPITGYTLFTRVVNTGTGPEAQGIQRTIETVIAHFRSRIGRQTAFDELVRVAASAREAGWDKYDGKPLTAETCAIALRFLSALPSTLPDPEVGLDPDGEVSFEWMNGREKIFTVSLNGNGRLSYAGAYGDGVTAHGTEPFEDVIPPTIIGHIERLDLPTG